MEDGKRPGLTPMPGRIRVLTEQQQAKVMPLPRTAALAYRGAGLATNSQRRTVCDGQNGRQASDLGHGEPERRVVEHRWGGVRQAVASHVVARIPAVSAVCQ